MCMPPEAMAGASFAIGAAQAVAKYGAAQQDAASQLAYQAQERYNAEVARNQQYNQIGARQVQEADAGVQAKFDNAIRAERAVATTEASAASSGVEGQSIESVARNFYREQGRIDAATDRNLKMNIQQLQEEKDGAAAQYAGRTNFPAVRQPSMLGLGLEIGGSAVNAYDLFDRANGRVSTKKSSGSTT